MRPPVALLVPLALLLAGCLSGEPAPEPAADAGAVGADAARPADADPTADPEGQEADGMSATDGEATSAYVVHAAVEGRVTSVGAGIHTETVSACCPALEVSGEGTVGSFAPEPGLAGIVVELVWADATWDLDLFLHAPDHMTVFPPELNGTSITTSRGHSYNDYDGLPGSPDARAVVVVVVLGDDESLALAGEWSWRVGTKTANDVPFTLHVSLFYGEAPAEGYTAVE